MSVQLTKRIAADLLSRGVSSIRIKGDVLEKADKAITREDVRELIKSGGVYAQKEKHNLSLYSKELKKKRAKGRRRGIGRKKGTRAARASIDYPQKVRAQRRVLFALKRDKTINNELFRQFYKLVRGGTFANKASLLGHIKSHGVTISDERMKELRHI
jgi:large subunit ribosomal protein L19e